MSTPICKVWDAEQGKYVGVPAAQGAKKGGRLALLLERLRYQVLNKVRYAAALRFGGGLKSFLELRREPDV